MSTTSPVLDGPGDLELFTRLRLGDLEAADRLAARHEGATGVLPGRSDDLAMRATLEWAESTPAPEVPFRAALLAHHVHGALPQWPADDAVWTAYVGLPAAWRLALWHREVEGEDTATIGGLLGVDQREAVEMLADAASALRAAVVDAHARAGLADECAELYDAYLPAAPLASERRVSARLREHGSACPDCLALIRDLFLVEHGLGETLAGTVLGTQAAALYLSSRARPGRLRSVARAGLGARSRAVLAVLTTAGLGAAAASFAVLGAEPAEPGHRAVPDATVRTDRPGAVSRSDDRVSTPETAPLAGVTPTAVPSALASPEAPAAAGLARDGRVGTDAAVPGSPHDDESGADESAADKGADASRDEQAGATDRDQRLPEHPGGGPTAVPAPDPTPTKPLDIDLANGTVTLDTGLLAPIVIQLP